MCHFAVQGWEAGSADESTKASNHTAATRQAEKGSAVGLQGAGTVLRSNSWEDALVPAYQGGNTAGIAKPYLRISLS